MTPKSILCGREVLELFYSFVNSSLSLTHTYFPSLSFSQHWHSLRDQQCRYYCRRLVVATRVVHDRQEFTHSD